MPFTLRNIKEELEDIGPGFDGPPDLEFRAATKALELEKSALSYQRVPPGYRFPYGHRHEAQEEVYVVVRGSGRMKVDDEIVQLAAWDAVRVPPGMWRGYEAGPEGLEILGVPAAAEAARRERGTSSRDRCSRSRAPTPQGLDACGRGQEEARKQSKGPCAYDSDTPRGRFPVLTRLLAPARPYMLEYRTTFRRRAPRKPRQSCRCDPGSVQPAKLGGGFLIVQQGLGDFADGDRCTRSSAPNPINASAQPTSRTTISFADLGAIRDLVPSTSSGDPSPLPNLTTPLDNGASARRWRQTSPAAPSAIRPIDHVAASRHDGRRSQRGEHHRLVPAPKGLSCKPGIVTRRRHSACRPTEWRRTEHGRPRLGWGNAWPNPRHVGFDLIIVWSSRIGLIVAVTELIAFGGFAERKVVTESSGWTRRTYPTFWPASRRRRLPGRG